MILSRSSKRTDSIKTFLFSFFVKVEEPSCGRCTVAIYGNLSHKIWVKIPTGLCGSVFSTRTFIRDTTCYYHMVNMLIREQASDILQACCVNLRLYSQYGNGNYIKLPACG